MTNDQHTAEAAALLKLALLYAHLIGPFERKAYVEAAVTIGSAAAACQMSPRTQVDAVARLCLQAYDQGIRHSTQTTPMLYALRAALAKGLKRPTTTEAAFTHLADLTAEKVTGYVKQSQAAPC